MKRLKTSLPEIIAITSLKPPPGVSELESISLDLPADALRRNGVHAEEISREERRLVTPGASANLEDRVLLVVGILRDEELEELGVEIHQFGLELLDLAPRHLGDLGVRVLRHGPRIFELAQHLAVARPHLVDGPHGAEILGEVAKPAGLSRDLGVGELALDLASALFDFDDSFEVLGHRCGFQPSH